MQRCVILYEICRAYVFEQWLGELFTKYIIYFIRELDHDRCGADRDFIFQPEFYYILSTGEVDATRFCSIILQGFPCNTPDARLQWGVSLPPPPPKASGNRVARRPLVSPSQLKIIISTL
jgi:hypothetical protein